MTLIVSMAVFLLLALYILLDLKGRKSNRINLERNDVVFLRRSFRKEYPNVSSSCPLRITRTDGERITVTFMHPSKREIFEETIMMSALKKVS